jgi:NADH dehydrogenase (ubiquinone) 1 alpha subcomplex subunit 9
MEFNGRDEDSIRASIRDADVVINLIGKYYETKHIVPTRRADGSLSNINYDFNEVHNEIPAKIARIAKEQGVRAMIHMSAMSASEESASAWSRSKAAGEKSVRAEFPEAIIVKPAQIFGPEDFFLNWYAEMAAMYPVIPLVNNGENICQPVFCQDVGRAIMALIYNHDAFAGGDVVLAGPEQYTYREIIEYVLEIANLQKSRTLVGVPQQAIEMFCKINQLGMNPTYTIDNLKQTLENNILAPHLTNKPDNLFTFEDLGIQPADMAKVSYDFLYRFRSGGHFREIQGYH